MSCHVNDADTAFMMFAVSFVCLQTPALALTQAGLVQRKNALSILMQVFYGLVVGSLLFFVVGFSMIFDRSMHGVVGDFRSVFLRDVSYSSCVPELAPSIPSMLFVTWQMMFALMVPPIVTGAWAERLRFEAYIVFVPVFSLCYYFLAHWIWNPAGWLAALGTRDFAGGLTIHLNTGIGSLVAASLLARRRERLHTDVAHHSLPLSFVGVAITFVGWYSFNGGSALRASPQAATALLNTHVSACAGALAWLVIERARDGHWHLTSMTNGALAGLATITAASGYVEVWAAVLIGTIGALASRAAATLVKERLLIDDVLDVFALQGVPGLVGSLLLSVFAVAHVQSSVSADDAVRGFVDGDMRASLRLLGAQCLGVLVTVLWSGSITFVTFKAMRRVMHIDVGADEEERGLDVVQMREQAYDMALDFLSDLGDEMLTIKLCDAASAGKLDDLDRLLRAGANADQGDYDGRRAVHVAAAEGKERALQLLYTRARVDLNVKDRWGHTPMDEGVRGRHPNIVQWLRARRCAVSQEFGTRTLLRAASDDDGELIELLFAAGARASWADYDRRTALHVAIQKSNAEAVKVILRHMAPGAEAVMKDRYQRAPSDYIDASTPSRIRVLIEEFSRRRSVAVMDASAAADLAAAAQQQPIKSTKNDSGSLRQQLMADKAERERRAVARDLCAAASVGDMDEISRILKKSNRPHELVNISDYDDRTPLMVAAAENQVDCVVFLCENGARVDAVDRYGHTAMFEAVMNRHADVANVLARYARRDTAVAVTSTPLSSALINAVTDDGGGEDASETTSLLVPRRLSRSPPSDAARGGGSGSERAVGVKPSSLCAIAARGDTALLRDLWRFGVVRSLDVADYDGRTPLHVAVSENRVDCVDFLVNEAAVNVRAIDAFGNTPLADAKRNQFDRVVRLIEGALAK